MTQPTDDYSRPHLWDHQVMQDDITGLPHEGMWWLPSEPTRRRGGVLELGRVFELRTMGTFTEHGFPSNELPERVLNGIAPRRAITLLGCRQRYSNVTIGGYVTLRIAFDVALLGQYHISSFEEAVFDRVQLRLENLVNWTNRHGIDYEATSDGQLEARHVTPPTLTADVPGARLRLIGRMKVKEDRSRLAWDAVEILELDLVQPTPVLEIERQFVRPLRYLLDLASNEPCDAITFQVAQSSHPDPRPGLLWFDVDFYKVTVSK